MSYARPIVRVRGVQSGRPCFENSRFPVDVLGRYIQNGYSDEMITDHFPELTEDDLETAHMLYEVRHAPVRCWQEQPGEISWQCSCGHVYKHQPFGEMQCTLPPDTQLRLPGPGTSDLT